MAKQKKEKVSFEDALKRLEEIVEELENEDTPLDKAAELFEEGKKLSALGMARLKEVEKKIKILIEEGDEVRYEDFPSEEQDSEEGEE